MMRIGLPAILSAGLLASGLGIGARSRAADPEEARVEAPPEGLGTPETGEAQSAPEPPAPRQPQEAFERQGAPEHEAEARLQEREGDKTSEEPAETGKPQVPERTQEPDWSFSASLYTYVVPDAHAYVQPTVTADYRGLHLEGRYNYEDLETGSAWAGYNFEIGEEPSLKITPMLGGVFGRTMGIAPGFRGSLSWWWLELYGEGECVFDLGDGGDSFLYCWTELTVSPWEWLRVGLVAQRTLAYESDLAVQRGFFVGFSFLEVDLTTYVFNPDEDPPTFVISVGVGF